MAQSGYTPILIYASGTATNVPLAANLTSTATGAELALNYADGKLYYKNGSGVVTLLAQSAAASPVTTISFGSTGLTPSTATSGAITVAGLLATGYGGTGLTGFTAANNAIYSTSSSVLTAGTLPVAAGGIGATSFAAANIALFNTSQTWTATQTFNGTSAAEAIKTLNIAEPANVVGTAPTSTTNLYINSGAVQYYTANNANNWTLNFAFSSGTSLNTAMAVGDSISCTMIVTNSATAYYPSAFQIDGTSVTPKWQGGSAPTSGDASALDSYTFVIIKTASATYTVLASQTKFS